MWLDWEGCCSAVMGEILIWLEWLLGDRGVLLISIGGVFPHACIRPPRKMGMYVTSQSLKTGEFCNTWNAIQANGLTMSK